MANIFDERLIVNNEVKENIIYNEHLARYELAKEMIAAKGGSLPIPLSGTGVSGGEKILDAACGSGYGSKILAETGAKEVVAIDISPEAIKLAKELYSSPNIKYVLGDVKNTKEENNTFDFITSFETIEHLDNPSLFLKELKRVLKSDGLAVISTPNSEISGEGNPFHLREFSRVEFTELVGKYFKYFKIIEQGNGIASFIKCGSGETGINKLCELDDFKPLYFIAICSETNFNEQILKKNIISINFPALQNFYNNPGLKIVNKVYALLVKIPGAKKLLRLFRKTK